MKEPVCLYSVPISTTLGPIVPSLTGSSTCLSPSVTVALFSVILILRKHAGGGVETRPAVKRLPISYMILSQMPSYPKVKLCIAANANALLLASSIEAIQSRSTRG
ncbi:protein of unknown function [Agrobacterium pusense]|uniref:Uncharacterized protein n=1 Tax=Agrobacterium pusense TaxID=648995 RepID=U4Q6R4_9HYPH|nr:protein of unknown function [Agrobacterium pusense]